MAEYLVWGGGGHGKVVADAARAAGLSVAGFVDADKSKTGTVVEPGGSKVSITEDEFRTALSAAKLPAGVAGVILAVGKNSDRARCRSAVPQGLLTLVVHPSAVVSKHATIGSGTVVLAGAIVNSDTRVGSGVIINTGAVVEHDCILGDDSHVAPGAVLAGNVKIGQRVLVGAGAVIIPGITVGDDATIGAGSVVIRDVPAGATVAGNPAKQVNSSK